MPLTEVLLHFLNTVLIIGASIPAIYMSSRIRTPPLRTLSILLGSFLLVHGVYHLLSALDMGFEIQLIGVVSEGFVEPFSYALLLAFAVYFARRGG